MIKITKDEAMYLAGAGLKWGSDIHRTNSNRHKYYLTEKSSALKKLEQYRASRQEA